MYITDAQYVRLSRYFLMSFLLPDFCTVSKRVESAHMGRRRRSDLECRLFTYFHKYVQKHLCLSFAEEDRVTNKERERAPVRVHVIRKLIVPGRVRNWVSASLKTSSSVEPVCRLLFFPCK